MLKMDKASIVLDDYKNRINSKLLEFIPSIGTQTMLRDACAYALMNGGKRLRPAIVLMVAEALKTGADVSQAAFAIEFFHTASLVADDLPCMDDDDERRSRPSTHKVYGETIALLVSYALIAAGYELLAKNATEIRLGNFAFSNQSDRLCVLALENATYNTGLNGATGGQFLDVFPPDLSLDTIREVIHKKTISLFEISFVFGWLFGGGKIEQLDLVKQAASHYGMAFQIVDDLGDMAQDIENERKVNVATIFGKEAARAMFHEEINSFSKVLKKLNLESAALSALADLLITQAEI
jgi:geranylgeranyl diphosphate synthase, type II